ncbi:hypothetical protein LguiB_004661 [Lonicera macranthoides]
METPNCLFPLLLVLLLSQTCFSNATTDSFIKCLNDQQISSIIYTPTNHSFTSVLQAYIKNRRFNTSTTPKPKLIITPTTESHVQAAVTCAKATNIHLKIRSGGHDYEGISYISDDDFVILDMFNFNSVDVDISGETAWVGAGATLGELYYGIWKKSDVHGFPAGVCPTVGVGGHLSGGGYGTMLRKYGLSVDHVIDARIVDVKGRVLDRSLMGEDLFWAIRGGGGGSFGVILSYRIKLVQVPKTVTVFRVMKMQDENATDIVYKWQLVCDKIDSDLFIRVLIQPVTGKNKGAKTIRASFIAMFLGDSERLLSLMNKEFPELGLKKEDCKEMNWIQSVLYWANFDNSTSPEALLARNNDGVNFLKRKSDYIQTPISKDGLNWIWKKMIQLGKTGFVFNPYGGRMSEISASETPFPHRAGNIYKMQYSVNWNDGELEEEKNYLSQIRRLYSYMTPFVSKSPRGAFLNYRDLDIGVTDNGKHSYDEGEVYGVKYFMGNYERLVEVKTMVDPENFFRNEQSIPPKPFQGKNRGGK